MLANDNRGFMMRRFLATTTAIVLATLSAQAASKRHHDTPPAARAAPVLSSDFGATPPGGKHLRKLTIPTPANYGSNIASVPWTNGRGLVTGATLQTLFGLDQQILAGMGTWNSGTGAYALAHSALPALVLSDITTGLGYTPLNKAGDTMSGPLGIIGANTAPITGNGSLSLIQNSATTAENVFAPILPGYAFENDGIRSTMVIPSSSPTGQTNALAYYGINNSPNSQLVGEWGVIKCLATSGVGQCWDLNPTITDTLDNTIANSKPAKLVGAEFDFSVYNAGTTICGVCLTGSSAVTPLGADGFVIGDLHAAAPGNTPWTHGFVTNDGTATTAAYFGTATRNASSPSQPVLFSYRDSANAGQSIRLFAGFDSFYMRRDGFANGLNFAPANGTTGPTIMPDSGSAVPLNLKGTGGAGVVVRDAFNAIGGSNFGGPVNFGGTVRLTAPLTVATLPTCNASAEGTMSYVTDVTALTYGGAPVGGGNIGTTVLCSRSGATPSYAWTMH